MFDLWSAITVQYILSSRMFSFFFNKIKGTILAGSSQRVTEQIASRLCVRIGTKTRENGTISKIFEVLDGNDVIYYF